MPSLKTEGATTDEPLSMREPDLSVFEGQELPVDRGSQGVLGASTHPLERLEGGFGGSGRQE